MPAQQASPRPCSRFRAQCRNLHENILISLTKRLTPSADS